MRDDGAVRLENLGIWIRDEATLGTGITGPDCDAIVRRGVDRPQIRVLVGSIAIVVVIRALATMKVPVAAGASKAVVAVSRRPELIRWYANPVGEFRDAVSLMNATGREPRIGEAG